MNTYSVVVQGAMVIDDRQYWKAGDRTILEGVSEDAAESRAARWNNDGEGCGFARAQPDQLTENQTGE